LGFIIRGVRKKCSDFQGLLKNRFGFSFAGRDLQSRPRSFGSVIQYHNFYPIKTAWLSGLKIHNSKIGIINPDQPEDIKEASAQVVPLLLLST